MKKFATVCTVLCLLVGSLSLWFGSAPEASAVTCTGTSFRLALPDLGALPYDQLQVSTGRTGSTDFTTCGDYSVAVARYGVVTGQGSESYSKTHWSADPGNGTKNSCFARAGSTDNCVVSSVTYFVYNVQVP